MWRETVTSKEASMYDEHQARQRSLSFAFKGIFWVSMAWLGFMLTFLTSGPPVPLLALLLGFAAASTVASIRLDIARGSNVVLWTVVLLGVGAAILGMFLWYRQNFLVDLPPIR
jgi:hypothetical protein